MADHMTGVGFWIKPKKATSDFQENLVTTNDEIFGGDPIIAGTRIPVHVIRERIDNGDSPQDIVDEYDGYLSMEQIHAAHEYARMNPHCGQPVPGGKPWKSASGMPERRA